MISEYLSDNMFYMYSPRKTITGITKSKIAQLRMQIKLQIVIYFV